MRYIDVIVLSNNDTSDIEKVVFSRFPKNAAWIKHHRSFPRTAKAGYLTSQSLKTGPALWTERERERERQIQVIK